jgi:hypothetical protein
MFIQAPFPIPSGFLRSFGCPTPRRFVALFWTPLGDESCWDDGQSSACGLSDNHLYLSFLRRKDVWAWRDEHDLNFGNSDEEAIHWLVVDADTGDVYAATVEVARLVVSSQTLPAHEE